MGLFLFEQVTNPEHACRVRAQEVGSVEERITWRVDQRVLRGRRLLRPVAPKGVCGDVCSFVGWTAVGVDREHAVAEPRLTVDNVVHFCRAVPLEASAASHGVLDELRRVLVARAAVEVDVEGVVVACRDGGRDARRLCEAEAGFKTDVDRVVEVVVCTEEQIHVDGGGLDAGGEEVGVDGALVS